MINIRATTDSVRYHGYGWTYGNEHIDICNAPTTEAINGYVIASLRKHEDTDFDRLYKGQIGFFV